MTRQLRDVGNDGNPNKVGDFNQGVGMGDAIKLGTMSTRRTVGDQVADKIILGDGFRAINIDSAYAVAGGATGALTVVAPGSTPSAGEVALDLQGNIVFAAADAVTEAEVVVEIMEGDTLDVTTSADGTGLVEFINGKTARLLIVAEQLTGGAAGAKSIVARGTAPAAGQAAITDSGTVQFNVEAANEQVRVKFVAFPNPSVLDKLAQTVAY